MAQEQKLVLITGATEGVGKQTAIQLAAKGFNIVMMVRNKVRAGLAKAEILAAAPNAQVDYIIVDLTSFKQVRAAAKQFNDKYPKLDVLINNAGLIYPDKKITEDGFELCFQTNHLSHFLLTSLVLDKLRLSKQGRIINLSSEGHKMGKFDPDNFNAEKGYSSIAQYCFTKLCNLYFTYSLAEKLKGTGLTVNAVHPGVVRSGFGSDLDKGWLKPIFAISRLFMISNEQGAATSVFLASDPSVAKVTGKYFKNSKETATKGNTHNTTNQQILWDYSVEKTGAFKP
jgi:NAD(P)-dependent dehydrogenase (short-subunit alcohol dehydrogenase family)